MVERKEGFRAPGHTGQTPKVKREILVKSFCGKQGFLFADSGADSGAASSSSETHRGPPPLPRSYPQIDTFKLEPCATI